MLMWFHVGLVSCPTWIKNLNGIYYLVDWSAVAARFHSLHLSLFTALFLCLSFSILFPFFVNYELFDDTSLTHLSSWFFFLPHFFDPKRRYRSFWNEFDYILGNAWVNLFVYAKLKNTGYSFWDRLRNFLHKFTWIVLSVHNLNKLGKFW